MIVNPRSDRATQDAIAGSRGATPDLVRWIGSVVLATTIAISLLLVAVAVAQAASALPCSESAKVVQYLQDVQTASGPCTPTASELPTTGYALAPIALIGLVLLALGLVLRRRSQIPADPA